MKIISNHNHAAILFATKKRNGNYNLYEKNVTYGYPKRRIAENLTVDDLVMWREREYSGLQVLPEITLRSVSGPVLIPHQFVEVKQ